MLALPATACTDAADFLKRSDQSWGGPPPRIPLGQHVTVLNAGSGDQIQPAVGEDFSAHTEESGTTGFLGVWGRGASNSLVPSGGPSLYVAVRGCEALAFITPWLRQVAFPIFFFKAGVTLGGSSIPRWQAI